MMLIFGTWLALIFATINTIEAQINNNDSRRTRILNSKITLQMRVKTMLVNK